MRMFALKAQLIVKLCLLMANAKKSNLTSSNLLTMAGSACLFLLNIERCFETSATIFSASNLSCSFLLASSIFLAFLSLFFIFLFFLSALASIIPRVSVESATVAWSEVLALCVWACVETLLNCCFGKFFNLWSRLFCQIWKKNIVG